MKRLIKIYIPGSTGNTQEDGVWIIWNELVLEQVNKLLEETGIKLGIVRDKKGNQLNLFRKK